MQLYIFTMGISFLLFSCKEIKKEIPDININEEKTPITKKSDSLKSVDTILNAASIVSNNKNNFFYDFSGLMNFQSGPVNVIIYQ